MTEPGRRSRTPDIDEATLTPAQRAVYDQIVAGPRGRVAGPLRVWLASPELAERAQALGQFARYDSSLAPHLSELAIIVTGRIWCADFEWAHHAPLARDAGVPEAVIEAVGQGRRPDFSDPEMAAVFDVAVGLHRDRALSDETFALAQEVLGPRRLVDLVGICGYYGLISMTINAYEVPTDHGPALPALDVPAHEMFT